MHVQIFLDTCIIYAYINPVDPFHKDSDNLISVIENPTNFSLKGTIKDFRGVILNIVEDEFFQTLTHKMTQVIEDFHQFYKTTDNFTGHDIKDHLNILKQLNPSLANFVEYILKKPDLNSALNIRGFYELLNKLRMIFRKKYLQLTQSKKIHFRHPQPIYLAILNDRAKNLQVTRLGLTDKKILVYADHLALPNNPAHLVTVDQPMLNQRMIIMPQLPNHLDILPLTEFARTYLKN
ncbi:MAG: hypothetical protein EU536_04990 [Promethearchaeota archaeon]|nr:MAG: hypothetical protein EU536_04990 [Candidatus Lokiarchaeota archaeon]